MDVLLTFLVCLQVLGGAIGVFYAMRGEFAYINAIKDDAIDRAERAHLDHLASGLWYGMTLVVAASTGLVILAYRLGTPLQPAETSVYWSFVALILLVTLLTWALSRERISFSLGSSAVFTGWWFLLYIALGRLPSLSLGASVALFVIVTAIFYALLRYLRAFATTPG